MGIIQGCQPDTQCEYYLLGCRHITGYVVHLNAADFGPILVDSGYVSVRFSSVAGVKTLAAGL